MNETKPVSTPTPNPGKMVASAGPAGAVIWNKVQAMAAAWSDHLTGVGLYLLSAAVLLYRIGDWPPYAYNWETYTAWRFFKFWDRPSPDIFRLTEGLMTDSGQSPLVALPVWLGFQAGGVSLTSMRVSVALVAALAVPLCWLVGRQLAGHRQGVLAAVLLALTPSFLLYGRSATLVGISLVPALAGIYVLVRYLSRPDNPRWLAALQCLLLVGAYGYAPVRFLWPLSLLLISMQLAVRRGRRKALLAGLAVTALFLPLAVSVLFYNAKPDFAGIINSYYYARGEQVAALNTDPRAYADYIRLSPEEQQQIQQGKLPGTPTDLMLRLIAQNAGDYARLLLNVDTRPTITDHWNAHGRLYVGVLVPFFIVGLGLVLWRALRRRLHSLQEQTLLIMFFGLSLPILLTSRVHVGRLIFSLPLLMIITACGYIWVVHLLAAHIARWWPGKERLGLSRYVAATAPLILIAVTGLSTWVDYTVRPSPTREAQVTALLKDRLPEVVPGAGVALVDDDSAYVEGEVIFAGAYRLELDGAYRFVNLSEGHTPPLDPNDSRPPLYFGGVLSRLRQPDSMPHLCDNIYLITPVVEAQFADMLARHDTICRRPIRYYLLP
jgi:4-amino-4-deoxy-L-arabinose transferase-like glycosyltransferase